MLPTRPWKLVEWKSVPKAIADCSGIQDPAIINFACSLFLGLLLERLFQDETISIAEQGALLGKMLQAYLARNKEKT